MNDYSLRKHSDVRNVNEKYGLIISHIVFLRYDHVRQEIMKSLPKSKKWS